MPTFTAIALDTLLEPGASKPVDRTIPRPVPIPRPDSNSKLERRNSASNAERKPIRPQITPSLYATPEATPLPDSPTSFPPSPYIINHKRRGPRLLKSSSESNVAAKQKVQDEEEVKCEAMKSESDSVTFETVEPIEEPRVNGSRDCVSSDRVSANNEEENGSGGVTNGWAAVYDSTKMVPLTPEREGEREDFYDPRDSMSYTSNTDVEDSAEGERSVQFSSTTAEFYDAWEELSSEGGQQQTVPRDVEAELREMRLSVFTEIEKRKQAEEALINARNQWQNIRQHLSAVGLTLPIDITTIEATEQSNLEAGEELCRQVYIARFVADSIGRGLARAELEAEMEKQIEAKNFEIARLCDKVRNYEAMNQEMVQRNRDVLETARRERVRKERRQRWIWGSLAAALTLGAAGLAWSYIPSSSSSSTSTSTSSSSSYSSEVPQSDDLAN